MKRVFSAFLTVAAVFALLLTGVSAAAGAGYDAPGGKGAMRTAHQRVFCYYDQSGGWVPCGGYCYAAGEPLCAPFYCADAPAAALGLAAQARDCPRVQEPPQAQGDMHRHGGHHGR